MLYVVKFIYQWLLPPACFIAVMAGLCVYMYRKRMSGRKVFLMLTAALYFLSIRAGANLLASPLEEAYEQPRDVLGDVLLMLGNGSNASAPDISGTGQPSGTMAKSMLMTARLHRMTDLPLLVAGGKVFEDTGTEADIAERSFKELGIPDSKLFFERKSRNTVENARLAHEICREHGWRRPVLLVVALQAPRTAMIFEREGMDCLIYPTHYRRTRANNFNPVLDLVPDAGNLQDSAAAIREYMGIAALKLGLQ